MKRLYALFIVVTLLAGCDQPTPVDSRWQAQGKTMGTYYHVTLADPPPGALNNLQAQIDAQLAADNHQLSTWQQDTLLSAFNRYQGTEPQAISAGMADIISTALRIGAKTGGAMDITIGPLVNLWGFGPDKQPQHLPTDQQIQQVRQRVGLVHLKLIETVAGHWLQKDRPDVYVDLSTVGEGYAADHLARLMEQRGITRYLVSVGGAVISRGLSDQRQPWRVAIQTPTDEKIEARAVVDLQGHGISTSGSYRNYYEIDGKRVSHIIDPASGRPIEHKLVSATVIATTALEADGWDTGLMVLGSDKAKALAQREGLAVYLITKTDRGFESWMSPQFASFLVAEPGADRPTPAAVNQ